MLNGGGITLLFLRYESSLLSSSPLPVYFSPLVWYSGREKQGLGCYGGETPDWEKGSAKVGEMEKERSEERRMKGLGTTN
jgi:hypothetical protein